MSGCQNKKQHKSNKKLALAILVNLIFKSVTNLTGNKITCKSIFVAHLWVLTHYLQ